MQKIIRGIHEFQQNIFRHQRELFERLAHEQKPQALLITCTDSRIDPSLITQTQPGELFILRNVGNIVPPYGASGGGAGAAIEFAVKALKVLSSVARPRISTMSPASAPAAYLRQAANMACRSVSAC